MTEQLSAESFEEKVIKSEDAAVVEVMTDWCPNCKQMRQIFKQTAEANSEKAGFFLLDADADRELVKRYKILGVPTTLFFRYGLLIDRKTGIQTQSSIVKRLNGLLELSREQAAKKELSGYFRWPFGLGGK